MIVLLVGIIALIQIGEKSKESLHIVQLEGYDCDQYQKWLENNREKLYKFKKTIIESKRPLVFTNRAKRLFVTNIVINGFIISLSLYKLPGILLNKSLYISFILVTINIIFIIGLYLIQHYTILISNLSIKPIEDKINRNFYEKAQKKIKNRRNLTVVGISGSFGKTGTKFILDSILEEKYKVLNTPESYNTPMGLSKLINNDLKDDHEVFIAELGARNMGDIKELSKLVEPKIAVITSIDSVHIETFKNIDNIMKTSYELIEELHTDGIAVLNYDNPHIKKIGDKTFKEKLLYGLEEVENLDLFAEGIEVSESGSTFTVKDKEGNSIECKTRLLGKHNIYNILAGVAVAKILGLSFEEIRQGIEKVKPIPHRLNIVDSGTGIIVIDNALNSNPIGSKAALEVLSQFKEGRKIIVTPGMIELGEMEEKANRELGIQIGKVCDYVILVGQERTIPIYEGLMQVNYNEENIFIAKDLQQAKEYIKNITQEKDVVLFENELPEK